MDFDDKLHRRARDVILISKHQYFPLVYSLITAVGIFGVGLLILQLAGETTTWAKIVSSIVFSLLAIWIISVEIILGIDYIHSREGEITSLMAYADIFISLTLVISAVWYGIYVIDNTQFVLVPAGGSYRKFISFWHASSLLMITAGFALVTPVGVVAEIWGIFSAYNIGWWGVAVLGRLLSVYGTRKDVRHSPQPDDTLEVQPFVRTMIQAPFKDIQHQTKHNIDSKLSPSWNPLVVSSRGKEVSIFEQYNTKLE